MDFQSFSETVTTCVRNLWWGGDPDHEDETSGLTLREIYAIQKSWAHIHANAEKYGMELFKRLFRAEPETKTFFNSIKHLSEPQLATSYQFKAHVINFMASLNQAVTHLNRPEVVIVMANKLGQSHGGRHVKRKHFYVSRGDLVRRLVTEVVRDILMCLLKDLNQSDDVISAWAKFVEFFFQHIFETLGESDE